MNEGTHPAETREPEEIERDIDRTRTSLGRTIDELENRLSPGQLLDQALGMAREHGGEFATNLGRSVENNPVPMLLTAVGIAWMMASSNEPRAARRRFGASDVSGRVAGARERVASGVESAKSAAGAVSERAARARHVVGDTVGHAGERVRLQGDRLRGGFSRLLEEQPLLVGAMGIAVGAALGAALPRTESEDRLLGETSDAATRSVKERARQAYGEARDRAAEMLPSRDEEQGEPAGQQPPVLPQRTAEELDELRRDH